MGDRRLGETWTPAQRIKNGVLFGVGWLSLWSARRMSDARRRWAGRAVGRLVARSSKARSRRAAERLERVFGTPSPVTPTEVFEALGEDLADTIALFRRGHSAAKRMPLAPEARSVLDACLAQGRGVVFATAHLGPIDVMAASVVEAGYGVVTLARESYDPRFTAIYDALRGGRGIRTIYRGRPGMETAIIRALRRGNLVGFPMDLGGRGVAARELSFLGERTPIPIGPARIARLVGAPVVVGTPAPSHEGMQITVEVVGEGSSEDDVEVTQDVAAALERRICALPAHWPWMHG